MHLSNEQLMILIPLFPLVGFIINSLVALIARRADKTTPEIIPSVVGVLFPLLSFLVSVFIFNFLLNNPEHKLSTGALLSWMPTSLVNISFGLMADPLSGVMILIITGIGTLIHLYSIGYMHGDKGFARYFAYINLFLFFMLLLVLGDNLLVLFVGWEGVGLCSYLLIGFWFHESDKAAAGKKAFIVNRIGDFGFLIGLFFILFAFNSQSQSSEGIFLNYDFLQAHQDLLAPMATIITLCLFAGATGKSAQIPLYVWLPDAMAGPTPVSALIHAATMVTAGIYMIARLHFLFAMAPFTLHVIASVGLATAFMAALIGVTQYDIKKVLAYSTVSQLGYMFLALGVGSPPAAVFHLMTHAFFKACLFLGSGSVIHAVHDQDIRRMGGLLKKMPITGITFLISTLAIAGVPPLSGFFSKDEILLQTYLNAPLPYYIIAVLTAGVTAFYMFRLFVYTFLGETRHPHPEHIHESSLLMTIPLMVLAFFAVVGGFVGVPAVLHGENHLHHWLHEFNLFEVAQEVSHSTELGLMGLSTLWAISMIFLSVTLYSRNLNWAKGLQAKFSGIYNLISNKFKIDEAYQTIIVKPLLSLSRVFLWDVTDKKIIDGVGVGGFGAVANLSARLLALFQTGLLGNYLIYLWIGLFVFLILAVR